MKKIIQLTIIILLTIPLSLLGIKFYTKTHSPFETVNFQDFITVEYCRPYINGREIFGGLVPYGKVWRTGANEATIITFNKNAEIEGNTIPAGTYSLWTIPNKGSWQIILNEETGQWGVDFDNIANRNPELDIISFEVPVIYSKKIYDQFTIQFTELPARGDNKITLNMELMWDQTIIVANIIL